MSRRWDSWPMIVLLGASLALNVYLGARLRGRGTGGRDALIVGSKMAGLTAEDTGGSRVEVTWASDRRPTVVYVFSPTCGWCKRNLENIRALSQAGKPTYRFIGLSLSSLCLREYVRDNNIEFPVYANPYGKNGQKFTLGGTPATLVVAPDGTLKESWLGAYRGDLQKEIEAKFHARLPGLAPAKPTPTTE